MPVTSKRVSPVEVVIQEWLAAVGRRTLAHFVKDGKPEARVQALELDAQGSVHVFLQVQHR
jgi:hypothetical protein